MFKKFGWGTFLFIFCFAPFSLQAATFAPTTSAGLQADLDLAEVNGEDDVFNLAATTYSSSDLGTQFSFVSVEGKSLTLTGIVGSTIIDGGDTTNLMVLSNGTGNVTVSGVKFQNGRAAVDAGLVAVGADVSITNSVFNHNISTVGVDGGMEVIATGAITFSSNTVSNNKAQTANAGATLVSSAGGAVTVENNTLTNNEAVTNNYGSFYITTAGAVIFNNNTVTGNKSVADNPGPVLVSSASTVSASGNTISNNVTTTGANAGIVVSGSNEVTFNNNTVNANSSFLNYGGAYISSLNSNVDANDNIITNNSALGGATPDYGGLAIVAHDDISFTNNTVSENTAGANYGGGVFVATLGEITFTGNTFSNNKANTGDYGAFTIVSHGDAVLNNNIFTKNISAGNYGVGSLVVGAGLELINNLMASNEAPTDYAGLVIVDGDTSVNPVNIVNNTVYGNTTSAGHYAGLYLVLAVNPVLNLYNNIFWGNSAAIPGNGVDAFISHAGGTSHLFNNDLGEFCYTPGPSCDVAAFPSQGNNLSEDPLLMDPAAGNYILKATSNMIDVGDAAAPGLPTTDITGNPRSFLTIPDLGAYEAVPSITTSPAAVDFGSVSTNNFSAVVVTLSNNGTYDLNVSTLTLSDTSNFALDTSAGSNPCGSGAFQILSGESCTIGLGFSPDAAGNISGGLDIVSDSPATPTYTLNLTGVGTGSGGCSLNSGLHISNLWIYAFFIAALGSLRLSKYRKI